MLLLHVILTSICTISRGQDVHKNSLALFEHTTGHGSPLFSLAAVESHTYNAFLVLIRIYQNHPKQNQSQSASTVAAYTPALGCPGC